MATTDSPKPRTRGTRKPLIPPTVTEQTEQIENLAALLSNPEGVKLSARVAELEDKLAITQTQLRHAQEENKGLTKRLENSRERYLGGEEVGRKMHQEIEHLKFELQQMTTERDGYAAELKTITKEANTQRKAADDAAAALNASAEALKQEESAGWVETWVVGIVSAAVMFAVGYLVGGAR